MYNAVNKMHIQSKSPGKTMWIIIIGAIVFLAISIFVWRYGSFTIWNLERISLGVDEVIDNYQEYEGTQIVLRGYGKLVVGQTLLLCEPDFCGCNSSFGDFYIGDILVEGVQCSGDQCILYCTPINPKDGNEYLLIGILVDRSDENQGEQPGLSLTKVDFDKSRKFIVGRWAPIK